MPTEIGRVLAVETEGMLVETIRRSACGSCAAQKGCGHALLPQLSAGRGGRIRVLPAQADTEQYRVGDDVQINIPDGVLLRGSFVAYGVPLLLLLAGALAAASWLPGNQDLTAAAGGAAGLVLGYALVRWHGARHRHDPALQPALIGRAPPRAEPVIPR